MPFDTVAVVGVGGVGMAHVIAADAIGARVRYIIDSDPAILHRSQIIWSNQWMDTFETANPQKGTVYSTNIEALLGAHVDILIIATPPHTHQWLLAMLDLSEVADSIIVEKPPFYPDTEWYMPTIDKVTVSTEWAFHKALPIPEKQLRMSYPDSRTTIWGYNLPVALDFGLHLLSVMDYFGLEVLPIERRNHSLYAGEIKLKFDTKAPFGLWVDDVHLQWQEDLFQNQLLQGRGQFTWSDAIELQKSLLSAVSAITTGTS